MKICWPVALGLMGAFLAWPGLGAAQQPKYGGTLRVAMEEDVVRFDANQGGAPGYRTLHVWNNIYNGLVTITPPPELKPIPELAESWEILDGGRKYVFHLVQGVKFHDGTDFDATAAKWNFDRILDPAGKSWVRPYYEEVDRVGATDQYTLTVHMKEPSGTLINALAGYFQGIPMASPAAFEKYGKDWIRHPVGTGPFIFKEWVPGKHVILEKNPAYFKKGLPYLDVLEFRITKEPLAAVTALRTGEIDFVNRVTLQTVALLEKLPGITVITGPEMAPTVVFLNMRRKPLDDLQVRRAIGGYGLDRREIVKTAQVGRGTPLVSVLPRGVPDALDLNEMYPYDPNKAKALLKEAGFDERNPLKLTILISNHDQLFADVATIIKSQLARVNVDAKINLLDQTAYVDAFLVRHDYDMHVNTWANLVDINQRSVSFFKAAASNYMGIDDPHLEGLVRQWRRSADPQARRRISYEMQGLLADQMYWINVAGFPFYQALRQDVKGYPFYNQAALFLERVWVDRKK